MQELLLLFVNSIIATFIVGFLLFGGWGCVWKLYLRKENWARVLLNLPPLPHKRKGVHEKTSSTQKSKEN